MCIQKGPGWTTRAQKFPPVIIGPTQQYLINNKVVFVCLCFYLSFLLSSASPTL